MLLVAVVGLAGARLPGQSPTERLDAGRYTIVGHRRDAVLLRALLDAAVRTDTFPGLPRPSARVVIAVAASDAEFRSWVGATFPEWGAAAAFPGSQRIVMRGRAAGDRGAGDPIVVLRHELAHLALGEVLGGSVPRWFDEGYASVAAGEWGREQVLASNYALATRGARSFAELDAMFTRGGLAATGAYALAHRAVAELVALDPARGLSLFFRYWQESGSLDRALRSAYGLTEEGFERHWQRRTRLRYGGLALMGDLALAAGVVMITLVPLYFSRRRRDQRRWVLLRKNEAEQARRARESALEALLTGVPTGDGRRLLDTPLDEP